MNYFKKVNVINTTNASYLDIEKINDVEKKITDHNHDKYITTQEFDKLTAENFTARLKQANLESKSFIADFETKKDFDKKLKNLNKKFTSSKTKHVLVENELNELLEKVKLLSTKRWISKYVCLSTNT